MHYKKRRRAQNRGSRTRRSAPVEQRFWAKVEKNGPTIRGELGPCWIWTGLTTSGGYGVIGLNRTTARTHRLSWEIHYGPIPRTSRPHDACVLHRCDNRTCVRPEHLFIGTQGDNMLDMYAKGRRHAQSISGPPRPSASTEL
jgi:hypothetical protein